MSDPDSPADLRGPHAFGLLTGGLTLAGSLVAIAACFQRVGYEHLGWAGGFDRLGLKLLGLPLIGLGLIWLITCLCEFVSQRGTNPLGAVLSASGIALWGAVILTTTGR